MTPVDKQLKSPFPYFGGKSSIADIVWSRFGDVDNFIEPFCGSCAVLLRRPADHVGSLETISDRNHFIANFWRAVKVDPHSVAEYSDWPVNEIDCHARHAWLMQSDQSAEIKHRIEIDPEFFDAKTAGWWCWGQSLWIGSGWCIGNQIRKRPHIGDATGRGVHRKRPHIGDAAGRGECALRREWLTEWMQLLADRLRNVRVCCGEWSRICNSESTVIRLGTCGIFLDPPYLISRDDGSPSRVSGLYQDDESGALTRLRDDVLEWCLNWGRVPTVRICVAEYEGHSYEQLEAEGWSVHAWKAQGGYSNQSGKKNYNTSRERLWFSPACIKPRAERMLF